MFLQATVVGSLDFGSWYSRAIIPAKWIFIAWSETLPSLLTWNARGFSLSATVMVADNLIFLVTVKMSSHGCFGMHVTLNYSCSICGIVPVFQSGDTQEVFFQKGERHCTISC